jgi:VCBS repeat-containing protein
VLTQTYAVSVDDGHGGVVAQNVVITITGTNDAPVVAAVDVTGAVLEAITPVGNLTDTGTIAFTDVDVSDIHSLSAVTPSGGALGTLTASVSTDTTGSGLGGVVTWNYSVAASAVEYLAAGQTKVETFSFNVLDGQGGSVARTVSVTVTGTNDAPNIQVITTDSAAASLNETNAGLNATGTLTVTDVDLSDVIASSVISVVASGTTGGLSLSNPQLLALLAVSPTSGLAANSGDTHNLTWSFASASQPQAFDYLAPGQSLTLTYTVRSSDNSAASDTQTVSITVNGTNDGPTAAVDNVITNIALGNNFVVPEWALLANDVDPDGGGALDISSVGGAVGLTAVHTAGIGTDGFVTVNDPSPAGGSFTYQATDGTTAGASGAVNVSRDGVGSLDGTAGSDIIVSANGGATLIGNAGNDVLLGGSGNDIYEFGLNDGTDIIRDSGSGGDSITIVTAGPGDATVISALNFERVGSDLVIDVGSTKITVDDHYIAGNSVENIQFSPGGTVYGYALSGGSYQLSTDNSSPLNGGGGSDVIGSSSGAETLNGGTGNDLLFGNGNADTINGDAGRDLLLGGAGNDTFVFDSNLNAATNVDTIGDFNANAADQIFLDDNIFSAFTVAGNTPLAAANFRASIGGNAADGNDFILYDTNTGNLFYDPDGTGAIAKIQFATLTLAGVTGTVDATDFTIIP